MVEKSINCKSLADLETCAQFIIENLSPHTIWAFSGNMGAGKTTLIKTICKLLGVTESVSSPTFSIVNEYLTNTQERIYHFDFYRLKTEEEAFDMGYEEYFYSNALCLIEWPEKISNLLPPETVHIKILKTENEERLLTLLY